MPTDPVTPTKRDFLRAALHELADYIATTPRPGAPLPFGRRYTADELLQGVLGIDFGNDAYMVDVVPDPSASDGWVNYCLVCEGDPHGSTCPVGMLEALAEVGLDSDTPVPAHLGLRSLTR